MLIDVLVYRDSTSHRSHHHVAMFPFSTLMGVSWVEVEREHHS